MPSSVVVIADEPTALEALSRMLLERFPGVGLITHLAASRTLEGLHETREGLLVCDWTVVDRRRLRTLEEVRRSRPAIPSILLAPPADRSTVEAMHRAGLYQYLPKPVDHAEFLIVVKLADDVSRLARHLKSLRLTIQQLAAKLSAMEDIRRNAHGEPVPIRNPKLAARLMASRKLRHASINSVTKILHSLDAHHRSYYARYADAQEHLLRAYARGREAVYGESSPSTAAVSRSAGSTAPGRGRRRDQGASERHRGPRGA